MARFQLSNEEVKNARRRTNTYRLADGDNLYLTILPSGSKVWQFRYRVNGRGQTLSIGKYPDVTLKAARDAAENARRGVLAGEHLTVAKRMERAQKAVDMNATLGALAVEWCKRQSKRARWSADYVEEVAASIQNHLTPLLRLPVSKITPAVVAPVFDKVEDSAPAMLGKVRPRLVAILDYAADRGLIRDNPIPRNQRRGKVERKHYPAIVDLEGVAQILRLAKTLDCCRGVRRAHLLAVFTAQRIGEVVGARWQEFDLELGTWTIPRLRMKKKDAWRGDHVVPLAPGILGELKRWRAEDDPSMEHVCPSPTDRHKPISPEGVEVFYRRPNRMNLGGKHSPHSWRSTFSTICRDAGQNPDVIEAQLDHIVGSKVAAAYDRAKRLGLRRELVTWYEEQLVTATNRVRK